MRILIVGCGYVGLPLGAELARDGHQVFGLRRSQSAERELKAAGIVPVVADIAKPASLPSSPERYDWVVHCASSSGGTAEDYRRVYLDGMRNLLGWLASAPPEKFVYTSSTGVYGQTDGSLVDESSPTEPASETARILVETERVLLAAARERQFPGAVLRLAGIYGPGRGYWLKQFLSGEARIEGPGERILNLIHRDDVAGAIMAALRKSKAGEVYNVVDDEPVTQIEMFRWLSSHFSRDLPPVVPEDREAPRKRGVTNKRVSNRKLRLELGWQLKYPTFRKGFAAEEAQVQRC